MLAFAALGAVSLRRVFTVFFLTGFDAVFPLARRPPYCLYRQSDIH